MAASANTTGTNQEGSSNRKVTAPPPPTNGVSVNSNGGNTATVSADTQSSLRHNPGISADWTPDEQLILEDLLAKYASDSTIVRYAKIAMKLKDKTVRDVALRCRWMTKKENGKRRKEDHNSARKNKDRREKGSDSSAKSTSHLTTRPNGPSYASPMTPMDNDDGIPYKDT
ncbi:F21O3.28 protein isoform 3 [Theobroma cacao]|uniref:F21O3.28 protein isoform 3 n=1 Tax=Theobroma cacao TaxID=3641 RepID=A0A061DLM7_THECC|nr:F21O3.28 protein isoform 3 [Theobroma cacao]